MKNNKSPLNKDKRKELTLPIIIAVIGMISTICAASITAYFGYLSTKSQIERPIVFTQTAEALQLSSKTTTPIIITAEIATQDLFPSATYANTLDWQKLMEYSFDGGGGCVIRFANIIPESKNWNESTQLTSEVLDKTLNSKNDGNNGLVPLEYGMPLGRFPIALSIRSIVTTNEWIKLENKVNFVIKPLPIDVPEYLHAYYFLTGCGGGQDKSFSSTIVNLQTGSNEYQKSVVSTKYDFFTLEPGEYDEYDFMFLCTTPGVYQVILEQQFTYKGAFGKVSKDDFPLLYCPKILRNWIVNAGNVHITGGVYHVDQSGIWESGILSWNGSEYSNP